jgi:hypothetical protein
MLINYSWCRNELNRAAKCDVMFSAYTVCGITEGDEKKLPLLPV